MIEKKVKCVETKNSYSINTVLKQLMHESGIIEAQLARQTGVPQTTVNRLLLSETHDPRANTLIPIANFFGVTIGQLLGQEPINLNNKVGYNPRHKNAWSIIPVIEWRDAKSWSFQKNLLTPNTHKEWITTEKDVSADSYALKTLSSMEPRFRKNSIIIVDPHFQFQDGNFVVICFQNAEPTIRRVLIDGNDIYFTKLYSKDEPALKNKKDTILGTVIETRINER